MLRDTLQPTPLKQVAGVLYLYDSTRSKWLSVSRQIMVFGINHRSVKSHRWLRLMGKIKAPYSGYRIPRNGTITSVTVQLSRPGSATFQIKRNLVSTLHSLTLDSQNGLTQDDLDVDIDRDDYLQCKVVPSPVVDYPVVAVEICWRL